jgi:hypothetical protein
MRGVAALLVLGVLAACTQPERQATAAGTADTSAQSPMTVNPAPPSATRTAAPPVKDKSMPPGPVNPPA